MGRKIRRGKRTGGILLQGIVGAGEWKTGKKNHSNLNEEGRSCAEESKGNKVGRGDKENCREKYNAR